MKTVTYTVIERVAYERTMQVADDYEVSEDDAEADWLENGDPTADCLNVLDREIEIQESE